MTTWSIIKPPEKMAQGFSSLVRDNSVRLAHSLDSVREHFAGKLSVDIQQLIHDTAMNPDVSQDVIAKTETRLSTMRKRYLRLIVISGALLTVPHLVAAILGSFTSWGYLIVSGHEIVGAGVKNALVYTEFAVAYFVVGYYKRRQVHGLGYLANCLVSSLSCGLEYYHDSTNTELRDKLAVSIERSATRYSAVFKRSSGSSRLFASRLRRKARDCRNDILSLIPLLVTADCDGIADINRDLARLLIRSQLGYWYQTDDLAKQGTVLPRRDAMRISVISFIKDRSIQVAFVGLIAILIASVMPIILSR
jgi:hypothetical protein